MNRVAIIGAGRFGMALAESLSEGGVEVLLIERNGNLVQSALNVVSSAVQGDATSARAGGRGAEGVRRRRGGDRR